MNLCGMLAPRSLFQDVETPYIPALGDELPMSKQYAAEHISGHLPIQAEAPRQRPTRHFNMPNGRRKVRLQRNLNPPQVGHFAYGHFAFRQQRTGRAGLVARRDIRWRTL